MNEEVKMEERIFTQ